MAARSHAEAELIRNIYECALDETHWSGLLARLTREFDSTYSVTMTQDRATGLGRVTATDVLPQERQHAYEIYYSRLSPILAHWDALDVGEVFTDGFYHDYGAYQRSEIYADFFRPLDADHLMFLELRRDRVGDKSLVLRRSRRVGAYDRHTVGRLKRLSGHLCNAERLLSKMHAAETRATSLGAVLDTLGIAGFVTDRAGAIRHMTASAEAFLRSTDVFAVRGGCLFGRQLDFSSELRAAIRDCADSLDQPIKNAWRMLLVHLLGDEELPLIVTVSAMFWTDATGRRLPASLVVARDPRHRQMHAVQMLGRLFGLTPAESLVAAALSSGVSLAEYAASARISVLTARTQLKRAQAKTGTHSQAELVGLLLRTTAWVETRSGAKTR